MTDLCVMCTRGCFYWNVVQPRRRSNQGHRVEIWTHPDGSRSKKVTSEEAQEEDEFSRMKPTEVREFDGIVISGIVIIM